MSSNVLKRHYTMVLEDDARIIDTNELIAQKLEAVLGSIVASDEATDEEDAGGFLPGFEAQQVEALFGEQDAGGFTEEMPANAAPESRREMAPIYDGPDPQQLLAEAREEIDRMKADAAEEIERQRRAIFEEAKVQGLEEGKAMAMAQVAVKEQELEDFRRQLLSDYDKMLDEVEPRFIDTLTGIYEHIFHVDLYKYRDIIVHLINTALRKAEGTGDILIHVSKEDYPYVTMQKKVLLSGVATASSNIEIIEDVVLGRNQCMIETGSGIFDCSLDTELEELRGKLSLLSYVKAEDN